MGFFLVLLIALGALILARVSRRQSRLDSGAHWRWCAACQAQRAFVAGRCGVCRCSDAEGIRSSLDHCLLAAKDVRFLRDTGRLEAASVEALHQFYAEALACVLHQSGSVIPVYAVQGRFAARMA